MNGDRPAPANRRSDPPGRLSLSRPLDDPARENRTSLAAEHRRLLLRLPRVPGVLCVALGVGGCTRVHPLPELPTSDGTPPSDDPVPLRAALVMDHEWRRFTFSCRPAGETWTYPLGDSLVTYARSVVRRTFYASTELPDPPSSHPTADVLVQPRRPRLDQVLGPLPWYQRQLHLRVEWTVLDAPTRRILWLETVNAQAGGEMTSGHSVDTDERRLFERLFRDLGHQTVAAFRRARPRLTLPRGTSS